MALFDARAPSTFWIVTSSQVQVPKKPCAYIQEFASFEHEGFSKMDPLVRCLTSILITFSRNSPVLLFHWSRTTYRSRQPLNNLARQFYIKHPWKKTASFLEVVPRLGSAIFRNILKIVLYPAFASTVRSSNWAVVEEPWNGIIHHFKQKIPALWRS